MNTSTATRLGKPAPEGFERWLDFVTGRNAHPPVELEVTVSVTMSKTVRIKVEDYADNGIMKDEDGEYSRDIDTSCCDLRAAVEAQVALPQDEFTDWTLDEMEVAEE